MSGGFGLAQPAQRRPLDGGVRRNSATPKEGGSSTRTDKGSEAAHCIPIDMKPPMMYATKHSAKTIIALVSHNFAAIPVGVKVASANASLPRTLVSLPFFRDDAMTTNATNPQSPAVNPVSATMMATAWKKLTNLHPCDD
jgi:hypothetical protein